MRVWFNFYFGEISVSFMSLKVLFKNHLKAMQSGVNYYVVQDLTLQEAETIALSILKQVMEEKVSCLLPYFGN